jgi:hypothetical protein
LAGQGRRGVFGHVHQQNLARQKAASGLKSVLAAKLPWG